MSDPIFDTIVNDAEAQSYLRTADNNFAAMGYKEHGPRHARFTSVIAADVMKSLGYPERDCELARVAGYLHDIGNAICRTDHAQTGAVLTLEILERVGVAYPDLFKIISAIGSHEDKDIEPPTPLAAAVILGDKTDVHHERVRSSDLPSLDTHARVNYACQNASLRVDREKKTISLDLSIDTEHCPVMEYFEIFLARTKFCRKASRALGCEFILFINRDKFL